jgi:transcriptional regulator with XRE-family HTH domain
VSGRSVRKRFAMPNMAGIESLESAIFDILREERLKKKLPRYILAERAGLSQPMVGLIERKERSPRMETFLRLCAALEVKPGTVITRAERILPGAGA